MVRSTIYKGENLFAAQDVIEEHLGVNRPSQYWGYFKKRFKDKLFLVEVPSPTQATRRVTKTDFTNQDGVDFILSYKKHKKADLFLNPPQCSIEGCDGGVKARGYCKKHYKRFLRERKLDNDKRI